VACLVIGDLALIWHQSPPLQSPKDWRRMPVQVNGPNRVLPSACNMPFAQLARFPGLRLNGTMRGAVIVLLGIAGLWAYSVGRQDVPASNAPVAVKSSPSVLAKPVAFGGLATQAPLPVPTPSSPTHSAKADVPDKPVLPDRKRKVEAALTAAAIAAIIVQASRDQYHAGGRPCACPDDRMRNGRACGGRSAYSRPGGAAPLCYPSDVTAAMIEKYRATVASR
jgi:hypothetical protein